MDGLGALGFALPSPAYLAGAILFGIVGWAAWRYGRKAERPRAKWLGLVLMLYPYAVSRTWLLYAIGAGLCVALVLERGG
ncbi:MAG TPA: hypothetical protein VF291_05975 [Burkholderiaceae bacterium]